MTRPGIFVPIEVRENLIEEGIENAHAEAEGEVTSPAVVYEASSRRL